MHAALRIQITSNPCYKYYWRIYQDRHSEEKLLAILFYWTVIDKLYLQDQLCMEFIIILKYVCRAAAILEQLDWNQDLKDLHSDDWLITRWYLRRIFAQLHHTMLHNYSYVVNISWYIGQHWTLVENSLLHKPCKPHRHNAYQLKICTTHV